MIYSSIYANDDCSKYPTALQRAIHYLKSTDILSMAPADYFLEGNKMFVKVFDNTSKAISETHPEFHKNYIDVQFWVNGEELIGICPKKKEYTVIEAHEDQDLYFVGEIEEEQFLHVKPGDYMILFPNDIHRPGISVKKPHTYRKAVVKVSLDLL